MCASFEGASSRDSEVLRVYFEAHLHKPEMPRHFFNLALKDCNQPIGHQHGQKLKKFESCFPFVHELHTLVHIHVHRVKIARLGWTYFLHIASADSRRHYADS